MVEATQDIVSIRSPPVAIPTIELVNKLPVALILPWAPVTASLHLGRSPNRTKVNGIDPYLTSTASLTYPSCPNKGAPVERKNIIHARSKT